METERKQSVATIWGNGEIFSKDLQLVIDEDTQKEKLIKGTIGIKTGENEVVRFDIFQMAEHNEKENFKFKAFKTIMEEYEKGNKVFIGVNKKFPHFPNAEIKIDVYEDSEKIVTKTKNYLNLINRSKQDSDFEYGLKFKISDFIIDSIEEEFNDVSATGRGILTGRVVDYKGIAKPIELKLTKEGFEYAKANWRENDVVDVAGILFYKAIPKEIEVTSGGFGNLPGSKPAYDYIREYVVDSGSEKKYDSFTKDEIETAREEYDSLIAALLGEDDDNVPF